MHTLGRVFCWVIITVICFPCLAQKPTVRLPIPTSEHYKLSHNFIVAALKRGGKYNVSYPLAELEHIPLSTRINFVRDGSMDVFFSMGSPDYEEEFQAIYIPIYRGLMGMRLAIVTQEKQDIFANVTTINELSDFKAGQGKLWTDAKILQQNGIPLVLEVKYQNLFRMLEADRFDYFPRGVHEPWTEIASHKSLNLVVDKHIMLHYDAPFYYFVNKNNTELAAHLTEQLEAMVAEGSAQALFYQDSEVKIALQQADFSNRKTIKLINPYLTDKTPLNKKELWFDPSDLQKTISAQGFKL